LTNDETALLVPAGDSAAFADAIAALLENPARALRIGARAREAVQEHTLQARVARVLNGLTGA
jgi:glycosyltransferase involved in cell wall biosynthesis